MGGKNEAHPTEKHGGETLSRLTARFIDPDLEKQFQHAQFANTETRFLRFSMLLSAGVFLAYGIHDALVIPALRSQAWQIRYAIFVPVVIGITVLLYSKRLRQLHQPASLIFGMAMNLAVLWIAAIAGTAGFFIYTSFAILFVTLGSFVARMSVVTQIVYTTLTVLLYNYFELIMMFNRPEIQLSMNATFGSMGGIAALLAYQREASARRSFLQERLIAKQMQQINLEKTLYQTLLLNILPPPIADRLKGGAKVIADGFSEVTVLFSDIVGFTQLSEKLPPDELVFQLNALVSKFDDLVDELGVEKIKTIGDAYMVVGGLYGRTEDHAIAIATLASRMQNAAGVWSDDTDGELSLRIGIHTGPVVAGVIGKRKFAYDVWGDTVNTASRMESHSLPGRVQLTKATRNLLGNAFELEERGEIQIKGKGLMTTFFLRGERRTES